VSRYIEEHRGRFGVEPICRVLDVSASASTPDTDDRVRVEASWTEDGHGRTTSVTLDGS
jgi:hypothetical protein